MRSILFILALIVSTKVWSCAYSHDVTPETFDNLPVIAFFDESKDGLECQLYLRETNNLLGLHRVYICVLDKNGNQVFDGSLFMYWDKEDEDDLPMVSFTISEDKIAYSRIHIIAHEEDPSGHSNLFAYKIPLSVLREHFKNNQDNLSSVERSKLNEFMKKTFTTNRKVRPNQKLDPTVKTPVESGNKQGTAGQL